MLFDEKMVNLLFHVLMDQTTKHENHLFIIDDYGKKIKKIQFFSNVNMKMFMHLICHNHFIM